MLSRDEQDLLFASARKVGFSHRVFRQEVSQQKVVFVLTIDQECRFTWELLDDGQYFLITSVPGVHTRTDSHFIATFKETLPFFEKWLSVLKEAFSTVRRYHFHHDGNSSSEPLLTFTIDHKQELTKAQRWGLWRIIVRAMEIVDNADLTDQAKQEVHSAIKGLQQIAGKLPQAAAHYLVVGLLRTNGALYPSLTEPFEELAFAIIERINPVA